jgi:hypothetical protein
MTVLLTKTSVKIDKSQNDDWLNAVMYLDPNSDKNICKGASKGCRQSCLIYSGRMIMENAVNARKNRTDMYLKDKTLFNMILKGEISSMYMQAQKHGKRLAIRLNGTSDLDFSDIYTAFPFVQFYEYTKRPDLAKKLNKIDNVHITFSKHENHSNLAVDKLVKSGVNVAIVFKNQVPESFINIKVIDGDKHDRRFEDGKGSIIGLKLKGNNHVKKLAINSGFAI